MNKLLLALFLAAVSASAALTACSSSAGLNSPVVSNVKVSPYVHRLARIPSNSLFVAEANRIEIFSSAKGGWAPIGEITDHVGSEPRSMAIDFAGRLFVANYTDNDVAFYNLYQDGSYVGSLTKGIHNPFDLDLDYRDNLAVAAYSDPSKGIVRVFPSSASERSYELTGVSGPSALAYDADGDLFVTNAGNNSLTEYNSYSPDPVRTIRVLINEPVALAFAQDRVYVANRANDSVTAYELSGSGTGGGGIYTGAKRPVALAATGAHLYILGRSATGPNGAVFDYNVNKARSTKITKGIDGPTQAIICSKNYLCVANTDNRVTIYKGHKLVHTIAIKSQIWSMTSF